MLETIFFALWFFLPAAVANASPIFFVQIKWLQFLRRPVDFGHSFRGHRIFGDHKTILGFVSGIIMATIVFAIQKAIYQESDFIQDISAIDYSELSVLLFGFLFGFGALGGDALKSFFKRQFNVEPGKSWFPFDQIDYIIGTILITYPFIQLPILDYLLILVFWTVIHIIASYIGYLLKLKSEPI